MTLSELYNLLHLHRRVLQIDRWSSYEIPVLPVVANIYGDVEELASSQDSSTCIKSLEKMCSLDPVHHGIGEGEISSPNLERRGEDQH